MEPLEIVTYPNPILRSPAAEVNEFGQQLHNLLDSMARTMYLANGIGLAAPQVNVSIRAAVIDISESRSELIKLINPRVVSHSGKVSSEEGCLSIPNYRDTITRHEAVVVEAQDEHGKDLKLTAEGLLAICLQHEIDHLDGILFIDRLSRLKRELFQAWLKRQQGDSR